MPSAKLVVCNRSGSPLGELSNAVLRDVNWTLNQPGSLNFVMRQDDARVTLPALAKNEIQLWIDDTLSWWGVPWRCKDTKDIAEFSCEGLLSYFNKRFITNTSLTYTSVEQFAIAQDIITQMQAGTYQSFNIGNAAVAASGVVRSRDYKREEHPNALDLLQEFSTLARTDTGVHDGFDIDIDITNGQRMFTPYFPYKGTFRSTLVLEYGRNIIDYEVDEDALEIANRTYMTGGSNGEVKFEQNYRDDDSAADRGEFQSIQQFGDESDVNVLLQKAIDYTNKHKDVAVAPNVTAALTPVNLLGVVKTGDTLPVRIVRGRVNLNGVYRVSGITWNVRPNNLKLQFEAA